ncbi:MAG: class D sortase, partial [Oscillospiraceae bacterium]|nr:class D sortase [Oscillospiraceae bacterium]
ILGFFGGRKIVREIRKQKLMRENVVLEIMALHIKAPVLEGTENDVLARAVGHFPDTGAVGSGNYCIAGHSSVLDKEYFDNLKHTEDGMEIVLYNKEKQRFSYTVTERYVVNPDEIWILQDFGDDRVTLVTCTDDGSQRHVVVGKLNAQEVSQNDEN